MKATFRGILKSSFFAAWIALLGAGFWELFNYANTPGLPAEANDQWPSDSQLEHTAGKPTLLVFVHPKCPCSQATIGELERLTPHIKEKVSISVVFFKPSSKTEGWVKDKLWKKSTGLPYVTTVLDSDGKESDIFGVKTSGQVLLYDNSGRLTFRGGITPARGHMGDSDGRLAILTLVETGQTKDSAAPVFGCSIKNPERAPAEAIP